ncbi:MHC class I heavy chain [Maritimibacter sp. DP1N21-5]|uniref:MHC class I heavy chain n=1 Tax=Maritimibacter sp. DP1N21-5 TaxID=2836867 RepID=UPI001C492E48|nr:MHC class I heavy chain [Maritimibacter sp. DP1N21-5]MBV7408216.1 MHC class I heavy chain [Maritimibacter sp. DP1N21-5]
MIEDWTNVQILECISDFDGPVTVIKQSDGEATRYVLGNGDPVKLNMDGTFTDPQHQSVLSVVAYAH